MSRAAPLMVGRINGQPLHARRQRFYPSMRRQRSDQPGSAFARLDWIGFNIPANVTRRYSCRSKHPQHDVGEVLADTRALLPHRLKGRRIISRSRLVAKFLVNSAIQALECFAQRQKIFVPIRSTAFRSARRLSAANSRRHPQTWKRKVAVPPR